MIHLLLIEDNPGDAFLIQEMLAEIVAPSEMDVEIRHRLADGLARLEEGGIDLVLLDLSLPDSEGMETVHSTLAQSSVPVVVLTGLNDQEVGVTAVQHGAQDYLIKGDISGRILVQAVHYAIERFSIEQDRKQLIADLESFAHTVAHDLKAPLGPVVLASEMLLEYYDGLSPQEVENIVQTIATSSRKMQSIVDELLLLSSVRVQDVKVDVVDMASVVDNASQRLQPLIAQTEARIEVPDSWPPALGYAPWLEEVWMNYLSNALKYGGTPPRVQLGAEPGKKGWVKFWVRDNGPGISPEKQSGLFTPFTRLDQAKIQGHGLGLSIVHRIVKKLGGQVDLRSKPGKGSTFMFSLPAG